MRDYIKKNLMPLLIGLSVGLIFTIVVRFIEDLIIKVILIHNP